MEKYIFSVDMHHGSFVMCNDTRWIECVCHLEEDVVDSDAFLKRSDHLLADERIVQNESQTIFTSLKHATCQYASRFGIWKQFETSTQLALNKVVVWRLLIGIAPGNKDHSLKVAHLGDINHPVLNNNNINRRYSIWRLNDTDTK